VLLLAARVALACPNCMAGQKNLTPVLRTVAMFMVVPFALCTIVGWAIIRAQRAVRAAESPAVAREAAEGAKIGGDGATGA
jgi:hypothetical protein